MKRQRRRQRPRPAERRPAREGAATPSRPGCWRLSRISRTRLKVLGGFGAIGMLVFGGVYHGLRPSSFGTLAIAAISTFMLGALAAPLFEPKLFPSPVRWQATIGAAAGALIAAAAGMSLPMIATAAVTGAVFGALADYWLKYL